MQIRGILLFLFVALTSANIYSSKCLQVVNCDAVPYFDPYHEEMEQELADEIDYVNDYMQMVADQLANDGVVVVKATTTRSNTPYIESTLIPETSSLDVIDDCCDQPKETTIMESIATANINTELSHKNETSIDTENSSHEMEYLISKCPRAENYTLEF